MIENAEVNKRKRREKDFLYIGWGCVISAIITPFIVGLIFAVAGIVTGYHVKKKYGRDTTGVSIMVSSIAAIVLSFIINILTTLYV